MANPSRNQCPQNRRSFSNCWDELSYICDKIHYYLHVIRLRYRAKHFVLRLREELRSRCRSRGSIIAETERALRCEYDGQWKQAVKHRRREIDLILQLYDSFTDEQGAEVRAFALQDHKKGDVNARLAQIMKTYRASASRDTIVALKDICHKFRRS